MSDTLLKTARLAASATNTNEPLFVRVWRADKKPADTTLPASKQLVDEFRAYYDRGVIEPPVNPEAFVRMFEESPQHAACIMAVVTDAFGRGWRLNRSEGKKGSKTPDATDTEDDMADATKVQRENLDRLCGEFTFAELLNQATEDQRKCGYGAWEVARLPDGTIGALYPVGSHTLRRAKAKPAVRELMDAATRGQPTQASTMPMLFVQRKWDRLRWFKAFGDPLPLRMDGKLSTDPVGEYDLLANEIIWFAGYSARSPHYPIPNWVACGPSLAELAAIREYHINWFRSGGMADRLIQVKGKDPLKADDVAARIDDAIQQVGSTGSGHATVTFGTSEDVEVVVEFLRQSDVREGWFGDRADKLEKEVLIAHQVPPYRIGWAEVGSLGGNAAREMLRAYRVGTIEPFQRLFEDRLNKTLFHPETGLKLPEGARWKAEDLDWELIDQNLDLATSGVDAGWMQPAQAARLLGFDSPDDPALRRYYMRGQPISTVDTDAEGNPVALADTGETMGVEEVAQIVERILRETLGDEKSPEGEDEPAAEEA